MNPATEIIYPRYTLLQPWRYGYFLSGINDVQTIAIAVQGDSSPVESEILCSLIKPGNVAVDVGANYGSLAIAFASAVGPTGKVFAFEPQTVPYQCLVANVALNSMSHVIVPINSAVGAEAGEIEVPQLDPRDPDHGGCSLIAGWPGYFEDKENLPKSSMPLITIDGLDLPACHLLKVDVEGMEPQVLRGAYRTIAKYRPILWVEHLDYVKWRPNTRNELLQIFEEHGYESWKLGTPAFSSRNVRRATRSPFSEGTGDQNVLALPNGTAPPDFTRFECVQFPFKELKE